MPDISKCMNQECPLRRECYRYTCVPSQFNQSYQLYQFNTSKTGKVTCEDFKEMWKDVTLKK
jgi:hypothetical protein